MSNSDTSLDLVPRAGRLGAEVRGVRLSADIAPETFAAIHQALLKHKVLFFRGQRHLDDASHVAFARLWGSLVAHPTVPSKGGSGHILELDSFHGARANSWHTDVTFDLAYPKVSVLRGVVIPAVGGDTVWSNTVAAYELLPPELKLLAEQLRAIHSNEYDYAATRETPPSEEAIRRYREVFAAHKVETEHPVVRVHPETGERSLVLGHFVQRFQGLSAADSRHLLDVFQSHITRLENTVRWNWTEGDIVIWDNRATQHYAIADYGDAHRVVRRVTIEGEVPVGVNGAPSVALRTLPQAVIEQRAKAAA